MAELLRVRPENMRIAATPKKLGYHVSLASRELPCRERSPYLVVCAQVYLFRKTRICSVLSKRTLFVPFLRLGFCRPQRSSGPERSMGLEYF